MPFRSPHPDLDIPKTDILTYLFPDDSTPSSDPIWLDAKNPELNLSPKQLLHWVKKLGVGFDKLKIPHGDVVLIYSPNHIFIPVAYLGIVGNSRCFSAVNPIYTVPEVVHQLKNTQARAILTHPDMLGNALAAAKEAGLSSKRVFLFSDKECAEENGVKDWRSFVGSDEEASRFAWRRLTPQQSVETVATINYSSGTTGLPKGVCISHGSLVANVEQSIYSRWVEAREKRPIPKERWIGFLPLYHAYGQLYANLIATKTNTPIYIMKAFNYVEFLSHIQKYKITHLQVAPPVLLMMCKRPETKDYDLSSLEWILCGAAPLSLALQNEVMQRFGTPIRNGWGMTEVTCGSILQFEPSNDGNLGNLIPNTECKILDDSGKEVEPGQPGEMYIRAPNVMLRYWANEEATKDSLSPDGWLKTGDIVKVDEKGLFWIVDRKKELIKVNALQVAPAELESLLLGNDDIADAAVTGIYLHDEEWPRAYVALSESAKGKVNERDIQDWVKQRVAKHKQLVGGVKFVDEVPKLASGKIQRKVMREWAKTDAPAIEKEGNVREKAKL